MLPPQFEDFFDNLVFEKTEKQIGESPIIVAVAHEAGIELNPLLV